jgi:ankyrin repeat protein
LQNHDTSFFRTRDIQEKFKVLLMKTNRVVSSFGFRASPHRQVCVIRHSSIVIFGCLLLSALFFLRSPSLAATNLTAALQQALFEEEANHNLAAAIQSYQSLITQFDQDRKLAATAIFRLGECYRKQGNTNDASTQYQRIVREFSDQSTLLDLSRQNLAALGIAVPSPASSATASAARAEQKRLLEEEIKLAEKLLSSQRKQVETGVMSPDGLIPAQRDVLKLRRQLAALDAGQPSTDANTESSSGNDAERVALEKQIAELKALPKEKLRVAIQQSFPNPVLNSLMEQLVSAEQRLATAQHEYGPEHTEVIKAKTLVETVSRQIDVQVDAAMEALELKRSALAAASASSRSRTEVAGATSAESEEVRRIQSLIKNSPDLINSPSAGGGPNGGRTLLQEAAAKGELSVVKLLLDNGAAVDGLRQGEVTPLDLAAFNGHKAVVDFLLSKGAKADARTENGITPLHLAANKGYELVARALLNAGAPVNAPIKSEDVSLGYKFTSGETPLHTAAYSGYPSLVQLLLSKGADPNAVDAEGHTPLSSSVSRGDENTSKILLAAHADPNVGRRDLPLLDAAHKGDATLLELLLSNGADPNTNSPSRWVSGGRRASALYVAVANHQPQVIAILARFKANLNAPGLLLSGNPVIFEALNRRDLESLKGLLENGANPNVFSQDGYTPLATAVNSHDNPAVETLLAHHADPNQKIEATFGEGGKGYTPLLIATAKVLPDLVDVLLAAGADPNLKTETRAPLFNALNNENPAKRQEMVASLLAHGAKPNIKDANGKTPLMYAVLRGDKETTTLLLAHKADVDALAKDGSTALHSAVAYNHPDLVELLLTNKADPNVRDSAGRTPLDLTRNSIPAGMPVPNYPQSPGSIPTRALRLPGVSTPTAEAEAPTSIADILRQHGAADELPDFSLIRVSRKGMGPRQIFKHDTNSFNRFTLFETIASASYLNIQYPDFSQLRIHRPDPAKPGKSKEIRINAMLTPTTFDCAKDTWLEFGDVIEIPEREHTLTEDPNYGSGAVKMDTLTKCLARKVKFVVRDQSVELALPGYNFETYLASAMQRQTVQAILRSTSDFSHVHVKRTDPETKKPAEFTVDVQSIWFNKSPRTDDLWLREGDVIEVPDKAE